MAWSIARLVAAALLVQLALPLAAGAQYKIGISDQQSVSFSDTSFQQLQFRFGRLVVPWDWQTRELDRVRVETWLAAAEDAGVAPLISFNHSRVQKRKLPSANTYRKLFKEFRRLYPWITDYSPWNEVNHISQPTFHKPKWAATYYNIVRSSCAGCNIVAADVLDQGGMEAYLKEFLRYAKGTPKLWGLHNYRDTNYFRSKGTKALLRTVRGSVWLTETGGIVKFFNKLLYNTARAKKATKFMFKLAASNPRIKRLYIYSWRGEKRGARFDAGLVGPDGSPRPAYYVVKNKMSAHR